MDRNVDSISRLTESCISKFEALLACQSLGRLEAVENRLADFNLWAEGVGALAKPGTSLDSRLQGRPKDLVLVKNVLYILAESIDYYMSRLDIDTDSDDDIQNIDSAINNLAMIGVAIRRTGKASRNRRADRAFNPQEHQDFRNHLECLVLLRPTEEPLFHEKDGLYVSRLDTSKLSGLQKRLIEANLRRRHNFLLAQKRSGTTRKAHENSVPISHTKNEMQQRMPIHIPTVSASQVSRPDLNKGKQRETPTSPESSVASTAEGSLQYAPEQHTPVVARTQITTIATDTEFPRPPRLVSGRGISKCPCCCQSLPFDTLNDPKKWKQHVIEDLCPYTCIAENCPSPHLIFCTRKEWENHVRDSHLPRWQCPFCEHEASDCTTMESMCYHLQIDHKDELVDQSLSTLLSWSAVQMVGIKSCPLCLSSGPEDSPELIDHVLRHTYEFALRALPWPKPIIHDLNLPPGTFNPNMLEPEEKAKNIPLWITSLIHDMSAECSTLHLRDFDRADHSGQADINCSEYSNYVPVDEYFDDRSEDKSSRLQASQNTACKLSGSNSHQERATEHTVADKPMPYGSINDSHKAAILLRNLTGDAGCINKDFLPNLIEGAKREGGPLADFGEENGSYEKRALLPTPANIESALGKSLPSCDCDFCVPLSSKGDHSNSDVGESRRNDYAILVLCGCLFIARYFKFIRSENLEEFVSNCRNSYTKEHLEIFRGSPVPTSECVKLHTNSSVRWRRVDSLDNFCNECRWTAFQDAFHLKGQITKVAGWKPSIFQPDDLLDVSQRNIPYIRLQRIDGKSKRFNVRFFAAKIHPFYNNSKTEDHEEVEVFRKVYAYQWLVESEQYKIRKAKKEIIFAYEMSRRHESIAKLVYAFTNKGSDFELVELVFKSYEGSLDDFLLRTEHIFSPTQPPRPAELVDDNLWKEMVKIVEAVVTVHSHLKPSNPLDIKLSNILWGRNEEGRFSLYLTDFGHIAEESYRRATVDYAPPLEDEETEIGPESGMTYDVWSMACVLLQVLIFIEGNYGRRELIEFHSERQGDYPNAAFWYRQRAGQSRLRAPVVERLATLRIQQKTRTKQVVTKISQMLSIEPYQRDTMESCLISLRHARYDKRPKDKDVMACGCDKWSVVYQILAFNAEHTAHLAVYRQPYRNTTVIDPREIPQQEPISIDLNVDGSDSSLLNTAAYPQVLFSPAAFFQVENSSEKKALRFKGLLTDFTLRFSKVDQYHRFITLMTRQELVGKDPPGIGRDFLVGSCTVNKGTLSCGSGRLQLWKLLTEEEYDDEFKRSSTHPITRSRHSAATKLTPFKLMLWTRYTSDERKSCLVIDIGESTWEPEVHKYDAGRLLIKRKHTYTNIFRDQLRAAIFDEERDPNGRTTEKYPYIPIDPAQMRKRLQEGVVKDLDLRFNPPAGKFTDNRLGFACKQNHAN